MTLSFPLVERTHSDVKFIGVFAAPGSCIGGETRAPGGITFSNAFLGIGTWATDEQGALWELCMSAATGMRMSKLVWVRHRPEFVE